MTDYWSNKMLVSVAPQYLIYYNNNLRGNILTKAIQQFTI